MLDGEEEEEEAGLHDDDDAIQRSALTFDLAERQHREEPRRPGLGVRMRLAGLPAPALVKHEGPEDTFNDPSLLKRKTKRKKKKKV